jgi:putative flippase GtrA
MMRGRLALSPLTGTKMFDFRLARFVIVGLANTFTGLSIIFACKGLLSMGDIESNLVGYGIGIVQSFLLNKRWTFEHTGTCASAFVRYLAVLLLAYAANLATTLCAIDILHLNSYIAQALGVVPYALTGYLGGRWFAFAAAQPAR